MYFVTKKQFIYYTNIFPSPGIGSGTSTLQYGIVPATSWRLSNDQLIYNYYATSNFHMYLFKFRIHKSFGKKYSSQGNNICIIQFFRRKMQSLYVYPGVYKFVFKQLVNKKNHFIAFFIVLFLFVAHFRRFANCPGVLMTVNHWSIQCSVLLLLSEAQPDQQAKGYEI